MNVDALAQYGVLGIFAALMVVLVQRLLKREQDRSDKAEAEVARLNGLFQEKILPLLGSATNAIEAAQAVLKDIQRQREIDDILRRREQGGGTNDKA
jgi:hypothetical protein